MSHLISGCWRSLSGVRRLTRWVWYCTRICAFLFSPRNSLIYTLKTPFIHGALASRPVTFLSGELLAAFPPGAETDTFSLVFSTFYDPGTLSPCLGQHASETRSGLASLLLGPHEFCCAIPAGLYRRDHFCKRVRPSMEVTFRWLDHPSER